MEKLERREAFTGLFRKFSRKEEDIFLYPPYLNSKEILQEKCPQCDAPCVKACHEDIITITENKIPVLDFKDSGCTFCEECAIICPEDALSLERGEVKIYANTEIHILECLAWKNTVCSSCKDVCLDGAIDFLGMFRPEINGRCTNCGFCISVCPADAIKIKGLI